MTALPDLTEDEISHLSELGRRYRAAVGSDLAADATAHLVAAAQQIHARGRRWDAISRHLGVSPATLRRLRALRPTKDAPRPPRTEQLTIRVAVTDGRNLSTDLSEAHEGILLASSVVEAGSFERSQAGTGQVTRGYWTAEHNGVIVAFGMPSAENPQRFEREGSRIRKTFPADRQPQIFHETEPHELQSFSSRSPFVLHVGAHREHGATLLSDGRDGVTPVFDDDLATLLSADPDSQPAVLVLAFCDSVELAATLRDRDLAIISFEGTLTDAAAVDFAAQLYRSMNQGHPVRLAFEAGSAAVRGAYGTEPRLNASSPVHDRILPVR